LSDVVSLIDGLQLAERIDLNDVFLEAFTNLNLILILEDQQRHLIPVTLFSAGHIVSFLDVIGQLMSIRFGPVGDADHLPAINAADLLGRFLERVADLGGTRDIRQTAGDIQVRLQRLQGNGQIAAVLLVSASVIFAVIKKKNSENKTSNRRI